jgi:hypothetical protein
MRQITSKYVAAVEALQKKKDKVKLSLSQKLMVFGVSSPHPPPLLLMYIFAGFF